MENKIRNQANTISNQNNKIRNQDGKIHSQANTIFRLKSTVYRQKRKTDKFIENLAGFYKFFLTTLKFLGFGLFERVVCINIFKLCKSTHRKFNYLLANVLQ